jgi:UDP-N-acetylmuramoyl-L-alanyl-D-glutamate--2,6-diaminopimelate ligase
VSAVINLDDPRGRELIDLAAGRVVTYGLDTAATVRADRVSSDRNGLKATLVLPEGEMSFVSPLLGQFNIYNILAAAATARCLGIRGDRIIQGVTKLRRIPGRLERVENSQGLTLVVDYAHTPDALLKTFKAVGSVTEGRLITVFGCGGDRDKGKRFEMGFLAGQMSDVVFVTSDNPRSEDPLGIIAQIERGVMQTSMARLQWPPEEGWSSEEGWPPEGERETVSGYFIEPDRREAIRMAVSVADEKDVVLIAGKGHENYQIIGDQVRHFDDREEAAKAASDIP